jgi:hypothetical protein
MADDELMIERSHESRERRAHAVLVGLGLSALPDCTVSGAHGGEHGGLADGALRDGGVERGQSGSTRDFAGGMTTHPIGHCKAADVAADHERILVMTAHLPDVTQPVGLKDHKAKRMSLIRSGARAYALPALAVMPRTMLLLTFIAVMAGCRRNPEETAVSQPAPPPAAALARRGATLDESLRDLEKELSIALGAGMDESGQDHIMRAEAITDRLLEAELPFSWSTARSYRLEAYVRQIQALADRLVAEMRSGRDRSAPMREATDLRRKVIELRRAIALGGGNAPPSLDSLLAAHPADTTIITGEAGE